MIIRRIRSYHVYQKHRVVFGETYSTRQLFETSLQKAHGKTFTVSAFSYPAGRPVDLLVDYVYSDGSNINWRERMICPVTGLNNRLRAAVHLADTELGLVPSQRVYITEQTTKLYTVLHHRFAKLNGSEFLGDKVSRGQADEKGIRNEDLTRLTFGDASFDAALSFDCLEHMPDFAVGMREMARVSHPFLVWCAETLTKQLVNSRPGAPLLQRRKRQNVLHGYG